MAEADADATTIDPLTQAARDYARLAAIYNDIDERITQTRPEFARELDRERAQLLDRMSAELETASWLRPANAEGAMFLLAVAAEALEDSEVGGVGKDAVRRIIRVLYGLKGFLGDGVASAAGDIFLPARRDFAGAIAAQLSA